MYATVQQIQQALSGDGNDDEIINKMLNSAVQFIAILSIFEIVHVKTNANLQCIQGIFLILKKLIRVTIFSKFNILNLNSICPKNDPK
jgi:hypothetical protein